MRFPNWYPVEKDGVRYYQAWNLQASGMVRHGFSSRVGGSSLAPYGTLNLGLAVEDDATRVIENRQRYAAALGVDPARIVVPQQVHSNAVVRVTDADAGEGALNHLTAIPDKDALITNDPGVTLALHFADCVCVMLLDPENRAIGVAHAGWKGTVGKIVTATVEAMGREFGTRAEAMQAAIGPSVGMFCYEVGEDVAQQFYSIFSLSRQVMSQHSTDKWRVDLKNANLILLKQAGVKEANIAVSDDCTCCNREDFFSYRRDGVTGRMGGWLCLA